MPERKQRPVREIMLDVQQSVLELYESELEGTGCRARAVMDVMDFVYHALVNSTVPARVTDAEAMEHQQKLAVRLALWRGRDQFGISAPNY